MYQTTCPKCRVEDSLIVRGFTASTYIPLCSDGFSTLDAKFMDTEDEHVFCGECGAKFTLSELITDEE